VNTQHFPGFSVVASSIRVDVNLDRFAESFEEAQAWLGERILQDCRPYMPHLTGSLQQRSHTEDGGRAVVFPGPYARFQYEGKVMVDPVTRSPWARPGAKKVVTDRPLKYSDPAARDHWFEAAKADYRQDWIDELKRRI